MFDVQIRQELTEKDYWSDRRRGGEIRLRNQQFTSLEEVFKDAEQVAGILKDEAANLSAWFAGGPIPENFEDWEVTIEDDFLRCGLADAGTGGAVAVLNLVGCPTWWSCNGEDHGDGVPNVAFWARAGAVPILMAAARAAKVGLIPNDGGIEVFANSRRGLHDFAREVFTRLSDGRRLRKLRP